MLWFDMMCGHAIIGRVDTPMGPVPRISTRLAARDLWGGFKVRWGVGRTGYRVPPGLYAVGEPGERSPVLVSANYKLSFDALRKELDGVDAWILVVDTDGVNVWCSSGKGTFSADEVARRVEEVGLRRVVKKRRLILPQLAAPGVAAHEVKKRTGFFVRYGPVRARDLPEFLRRRLRATDEMRRVTFTTLERMVLAPVEVVGAIKPVGLLLLLVFVVAGIRLEGGAFGFTWGGAWSDGWPAATAIIGAVLAGTVITPLLLPWLPGRAFSIKGAWAGLAWVAVWMLVRQQAGFDVSFASWAMHLLLLVPVSSFLALNYTGCTTFTSLSGVRYEMRLALPMMIISVVAGGVILLVGGLGGL